jgi:hypothetical protein
LHHKDYFFPFLSGVCVKAEAATLFTEAEDLGLLSNLPALEATLEDVFSFFPIRIKLIIKQLQKYKICKTIQLKSDAPVA